MERLGPLVSSLLLTLVLIARADAGAPPDASSQTFSGHLVKTLVNGKPAELPVRVLADRGGSLYLHAIDLLALGIPLPRGNAVVHRGDSFVRAAALPGVRVHADLARSRLWLNAAPVDNTPPPIVKLREPIPRGDPAYREVAVRVIVDGRDSGRRATLLRQQDRWLIAADDLRAMELPLPRLEPLDIDGRDYLALDNLWPYELEINPTWNLLTVNRAEPAPSPAATPAPTPPATDELQETWVEINVNESRQPQLARALTDDKQRFYLSAATLEQFQLVAPAQTLEQGGDTFYAASAIPQVIPVFSESQQSLTLYAGAGAFRASHLGGGDFDYVEPDFDQRGALLNYALFGSATDERDSVSGQVELGAFWGRGFLSSQQLHRDLAGAERDTVRLESSLRIDWPEQMRTLTLGDTLNEAGAWGRPVRFGGLQWGRNFSTQPGFITFPTEVIAGESVVPSTIDIFVNNARRSSGQVQPGPFTVTDVPVVTGAGEMRIVMRDLLGRETVITRPFYASSRLLKPGLHEYSYEAGALRRSFTRRSNDYGNGFVSGTHRYGFNNWFTGEVRGETDGDAATLGLAANLVWPAVAEFDVALAASRDAGNRRGELIEFGFRRQARKLSFGAAATWRSREFTQLGDVDEVPDALESRAFAGVSFGSAGSLTLSHVQRNRRTEADTEFATLQYSVSLWRAAHLRLSYFEPLSDSLERSATVSLSIPLGPRTSSHLSGRRQSGETTGRAQLQRNLPAGRGFGYRLSAESGEPERYEAGLSLRGDAGLATAQVGQVGDFREYRASLDGGLAYMGGRPHLTRRLDQGFAVVDVPDMPGVDIYRDNQLLGTTDDSGTALIPGLREYQKNRIRIEDASLPLDIEVASLERIAIPAYRHGVRMAFDIKRTHWVGFRLRDSEGSPPPAGAQLLHTNSGKTAIVGEEGRAYIELGPGEHELKAWWRDRHCRVRLAVPKAADIMPDLGVQVCE